MVAGNFFDKAETLYAISSYDSTHIQYTIHFLYAKKSKRKVKMHLFEYKSHPSAKKSKVKIFVANVGSMFGAAMCAADLDHDGFSELLVGAPAQADGEGGYESGALHIYLGGDAGLINDISRHCVITGTKEGSRFGAAIAASDIDGDDLPEIFVSAPYEDFGEGALYVLSGFEVNGELIKRTRSIKQISLSALKYTQRIQNSKFKTFGYSLQVVSDLDGNGCDELAVGSPGTDNIMLLRCLPAIVVDVNIQEIGDKIVREQDESFTRKVCVNVTHLKQKQFSSMIGVGAYMESDQLSFSLEVNGTTKEPTCRDVIVKLDGHDPHEYKFYTKIEMDEGAIINSKEFNSAWATISPKSVLEKSIDISRHCKDKDCEPKLTLEIDWSGMNDSYTLGSSDLVTVSLLVKNEGNSSYDSCVRVEVSGAPVAQFGCTMNRDGYKCFMPRPLKRSAEHRITIKLNMSQPTNLDEAITVKALLFDYCDKGNATAVSSELKLFLTTNDIVVKGLSHNQDISDTEIQDEKVTHVNDAQEYLISNNGSVNWKNISAVISIDKKPFIESYRVRCWFDFIFINEQ
ncbi:hypothetical protein ABMA28_014479 [Loxostege sticticalis]|uniref:Integrin alpha-2 domain-containing protein n=1 Tax=Loxostege sticticalis TaxID=481309 RepID=A0ABD0TGY4_LOXSC